MRRVFNVLLVILAIFLLAATRTIPTVVAGLYVGENNDSIINSPDGVFDFTRDDAGAVIITSSDNNSQADLIVRPGGTASMTLGNTASISIAMITDGGTVTIDGNVVAPSPIVSLASGALTINAVNLATAGGVDYDIPDDCDSATGNWVTVIVEDDSSTISVTPFSGDTLVVPQVSLDADDELDSSGVAAGNGEHITLVCMATNTWFATSRSGAWVDGGIPD